MPPCGQGLKKWNSLCSKRFDLKKQLLQIVYNYDYSYKCYFPCKYDNENECSLYYHRKSQTTFYEEKKWRVYNAQENEDHLLLIRNGFPQKEDLPEALYVDIVHIDKFDNFKFMKNCVGNACDEPLEPLLGRCKYVIN